jgi:hypothetical protein
LEATIILEYSNHRMAKAVATAISPDNFKTPEGLLVTTVLNQKEVVTRIKSERKIATSIATIDDLLFCVATAEKTLQTIQKQEKSFTEEAGKRRSYNSFKTEMK